MGDHIINEDQMERAGQRIYPQEEYGVLEALSRVARFEKLDRSGKPQPIAPPMDIVKMVMARKGRLKLPSLRAVLNRPTIRRDGTLLTTPGRMTPKPSCFSTSTRATSPTSRSIQPRMTRWRRWKY